MTKDRAYRILPDPDRWDRLNVIEATHYGSLPGVQCPTCVAYAMTGVIYPSVDPSCIDAAELPSEPWPVTLQTYRELAAKVARLLGPERPLAPGTELGPLIGKAAGEFGDFAWVNRWTPLMRASVALSLHESEIPFIGVSAKLTFEEPTHESLVELEAIPQVRLRNLPSMVSCEICGRKVGKLPERIVLDASSFDGSVTLQRIAEFPTVLIANERFRKFILDHELKDILLTPIGVA